MMRCIGGHGGRPVSTGEGRPEPRFDWFIPIDGDGNRAGTRNAQRPPPLRLSAPGGGDGGGVRFLLVADTHPFRQRSLRRRRASGGNLDHGHCSGGGHSAHPLSGGGPARLHIFGPLRPDGKPLSTKSPGDAWTSTSFPVVSRTTWNGWVRSATMIPATSAPREFIAACRKLWREPGPVTYHGTHYRLEGAFCSPGARGRRATVLPGRRVATGHDTIGTASRCAPGLDRTPAGHGPAAGRPAPPLPGRRPNPRSSACGPTW